MTSTAPIVVGITGASGAPYAVRLLQALTAAHRPVSLIVSKYGMRLLATEAGMPAFITAAVNEATIEQAFGLDPLSDAVVAVVGCGLPSGSRNVVEFRYGD